MCIRYDLVGSIDGEDDGAILFLDRGEAISQYLHNISIPYPNLLSLPLSLSLSLSPFPLSLIRSLPRKSI